MPVPTLYDVHNRLARAEAALRSIEKALAALFRKLNVNRKRDPELDAVLEALAAIRHGLDHARGDRSKDIEPEPEPVMEDEDDDGRALAAVVPISGHSFHHRNDDSS